MREVEQLGYDGVRTPEVGRDPFLPHVLAATAIVHITIGHVDRLPCRRGATRLGDLRSQLDTMSKHAQRAEMGGLTDDEMLRRFAVVSAHDDVALGIRKRYGDVIQRRSSSTSAPTDQEILNPICGDLERSVHP